MINSTVFKGNFTQQEPISDDAIEAALSVLRTGRLHRYNAIEGEIGEVALLEQEFAEFTGAKYCLAVASGGYAMGAALRAVGVQPGDKVLSNGFTLAPVPGAIASLGAEPVFVETESDLTIDFNDLELKATNSGAKVLLLSHMRGHMCDMDRLMELCTRLGLMVIEDAAHTMGAAWKNVPSGRHGMFGCYSTQTYKHINSGEGGLLVSDDPELMAKAVLSSGSYMLYGRHQAIPPVETFEKYKLDVPNVSGRMDNLRAAILRPQLRRLAQSVQKWNALYAQVEEGLRGLNGLGLIDRCPSEHYVGSSFQFLLPEMDQDEIREFLAGCLKRGVELKWFGAEKPVAFTSRYDSWQFAPIQRLPKTDRILKGLCDMRLPLTFSIHDASLIASIIRDEFTKVSS